jgi:hypothetical protein
MCLKMDDELNYDFMNTLIVYCLLQISLIGLQFNSHLPTLTINVNQNLIAITTWLYYWVYLFMSFWINYAVQTIFINIIIIGKENINFWVKSLCILFYTGCYSLFVSLLTRINKNKIFSIAFLLLTHFCMFYSNFNSFFVSYPIRENIFAAIFNYGFYPFTIMGFLDATIKSETLKFYFLSLILQIATLILIHTINNSSTFSIFRVKKAKKYQHVFKNETII